MLFKLYVVRCNTKYVDHVSDNISSCKHSFHNMTLSGLSWNYHWAVI